MKRRFTAMLLALLLCFSMMPGEALADTTPATGIYMAVVDNAPSGNVTVAVQKDDGNGNRPWTYDLNYSSKDGLAFYYYDADAESFAADNFDAGKVSVAEAGSNFWKVTLNNGIYGNQRLVFSATAGSGYNRIFPVDLTDLTPPPDTGVYMTAANNAPSGNVIVAVPKDDGNGNTPMTYDLSYSSNSQNAFVFYYYNANAVGFAADQFDAGKVIVTEVGSNFWKVMLKDGISGNQRLIFFVTDRNEVSSIYPVDLTDLTPPPMGPQIIPAQNPKSIPYEVTAEQKYAGASGEDTHLATFTVGEDTYYMHAGDPFGSFPDSHSGMSPTLEPDEHMDGAYSIGFYVKVGEGEYQRVVDTTTLEAIETAFGSSLRLEMLPYEKTDTDIFAPAMFPALFDATIGNYMYDNNYCTTVMRLGVENRGWYKVRAIGTVNGTEISAESSFFWDVRNAAEQKTLDYSEWSGDRLEGVIPGLNYELANLDEQYTSVDIYLPAAELAGYIEVPESLGDVMVSIHGTMTGMDVTSVATTLRGGIISNNELMYVEKVRFAGAGKDNETWGPGPNVGSSNVAISGSGTVNADLCIFEGFRIAANTIGEGTKSVFRSVLRNNGTAVCFNSETLQGGNNDFTNNRFERNDIAIHFADLPEGYALTWFDISSDSFIDNGIDIQNDIKRNIFLPGNYFAATNESGTPEVRECIYSPVATDNARKQVLYYPQAEDMRCISYIYDTSFYNHTGSQTSNQNPVVSVDFTKTFLIPAEVLEGAVFDVMKGDTMLAKIGFLPQMRMMFLMARAAETFDATIEVERSSDGRTITITTQPFPNGKTAVISVPCDESWSQAKVTDADGNELEASVADGYVSFTASGGGTYTIGRVDPPAPSVSYFSLSFDTNGGSAITSLMLEENSSVDLTNYVPQRSGHTFAGWFADAGLTEEITSVQMNGNKTVYAKWELDFTDVDTGAYYHDAVIWAIDKGITEGTSTTTFSPNDSCTRAEMVTFLWRAAGSPAAVNETNPFRDVNEDAYYYEAVLWAVERGITEGTSTDTFSPDDTCTRGQMAAFLYRYADSPVVSDDNTFEDVDAAAYYYDAVLWASQEGITNGTSATAFAPNDICTRAQIVTFLYRYDTK